MRTLADCRLYGILDFGYVDPALAGQTARFLIEGGIDIIQIRAKTLPEDSIAALVEDILPLTRSARIPLVINDYPHLAGRCGADGVHLGQDDLPVAEARAAAGSPLLVGKSTHSPKQAAAAIEEGADYLGFGPLFPTPTKPDYPAIGLEDIAAVTASSPVPVFCIGGIQPDNLPSVLQHGAQRVVLVSGLLRASDIPARTRQVRAVLDRFLPSRSPA
ncbi:MAG TPA: thiamine phosphate synthase [Verrucomicrobiales bacterium]|nr:thiamine phosphate synthase [Verrucomicrobiales bacterium]